MQEVQEAECFRMGRWLPVLPVVPLVVGLAWPERQMLVTILRLSSEWQALTE